MRTYKILGEGIGNIDAEDIKFHLRAGFDIKMISLEGKPVVVGVIESIHSSYFAEEKLYEKQDSFQPLPPKEKPYMNPEDRRKKLENDYRDEDVVRPPKKKHKKKGRKYLNHCKEFTPEEEAELMKYPVIPGKKAEWGINNKLSKKLHRSPGAIQEHRSKLSKMK